MTTTGEVELTIVDNQSGIVVVPLSSVQVVIGVSTAGTVASPVVTRSTTALQSTFGYGPLVEAGAMSILAGGTIIACKAALKTKGTASAVTAGAGNTGATVCTVTVDGSQGAFDDYLVKVVCTVAGTIGTSASIKVSLDAGRNYGPSIALGTDTTYLISNTGVTLHFTVATIAVGDTYTFGTYAPSCDPTDVNGGIKEVLTALVASPYGTSGWGSMHIVGGKTGTQTIQGMAKTDAALVDGYLTTAASSYVFTGAIMDGRDASPAAKWGGTAEAESAWTTSVTGDYATASLKRSCLGIGHYNMPSAYANASAGAWVPRRSLSWAAAARRVQVPPQRHGGRVRDGSLATISRDAANDPVDGFVYHDERNNPGFGAARLMAARSRVGYGGYFIDNENMLSPFGSDITMLPLRNVMDIACSIVHQVGSLFINSDVRLNANGTIFENDAIAIELAILGALNTNMTAQGMISAAAVQVDRTTNVGSTHTVTITVTIRARGYILQENITIGYANAAA